MITVRLEQLLRKPDQAHKPMCPWDGMRRRLWFRSAAMLGLVLIGAMGVAAQEPKASQAVSREKADGDPKITPAITQNLNPMKLLATNKNRGLGLMEALAVRASTYDWSPKNLLLQDLSDLLWAANGINRPDTKHRTAPSAVNAQDVDIYVFLKEGVFLYDAAQHQLNPVASGDHRAAIDEEPPGSKPAALLILVSDLSRFKVGTQDEKVEWAAIDSGIVSQNISLFCAATGLGTRPRTDMNKALIKTILKLKTTQLPILNQAVGHRKEDRRLAPGWGIQGQAIHP